MDVVLGRKYSNKMYFIGIIVLLTLCPLYTDAACQVLNCLQCNDIPVCKVCHGGYYLEAGSCLQCPTNCVTCTNSTHCQICLDTYWQPSLRCSNVCPSGCTVAGCNDTNGFCYECKPGKYGPNCYFNCSICVDGDCDIYRCTNGCKDGYVQYNYTGSRYADCKECPSNCITCSNTTYCTQCDQGYYGSYYRVSTGRGTRNCVQCEDQCTECTSIDQCPVWCQSECIQQGCGISGNCSTTTPTTTTIKLTSTSKEDISTTIKSQENTPPATTKTTVCPTECMSGCDTQGRCHETTTIYSESDGPSASQDIEYHEVFGHGVATGSGIVIFIVLLIVVTCFLIRRTQCVETPCFAKTTTASKEQHVYYNTQTETDSISNPRNTPDYVNADNATPVQDSEYEINEAGEYSSLDERQLDHQYSDLQG